MESLDQINLCLGRSVLYKDINFHQHMPKSFYDQCFVVGGSFFRVVVVGGICSCCCGGR